MLAEEIIIKPIVTEKSNNELQEGKYTFKVARKATKIDIKRAVEKLFGVKVLSVNTMTVLGKEKRVRFKGKYKFRYKRKTYFSMSWNRLYIIKVTKNFRKL